MEHATLFLFLVDIILWISPLPVRHLVNWKGTSGWNREENSSFSSWHIGTSFLGSKAQFDRETRPVIHCEVTRVFPKIEIPQNGLFIMENPIEMDDLGVVQDFFPRPVT